MVKKIKIKIKTTIEKVSKCHFGLLVLVYNNNDCQIVKIKSVMRQIILSLQDQSQIARARGDSFFYKIHFFYHTYTYLRDDRRSILG